ncbi:MAG: hypothetical protein H6739_13165 [Alphaproteobacteria bacterium]|nr:hypothetical protein [Alphaproteobacteria bacterium]
MTALLGGGGVAWLAAQGADSRIMVIKVSVVLGAWMVLGVLKVTDLAERGWMKVAVVFVFVGNMFSIWMRELTVYGVTLNVVAGLVMMATVALPRTVRVDQTPRRQVFYGLTLPWILLYTLWDINVLLIIKSIGSEARDGIFGGSGVAQILGTVLACRFRPERYLEARIHIMSLYILCASLEPISSRMLRTPGWNTPEVTLPLHVAALAVAIWVVVRSIRRALRGEAPQNPVELAIQRIRRS